MAARVEERKCVTPLLYNFNVSPNASFYLVTVERPLTAWHCQARVDFLKYL